MYTISENGRLNVWECDTDLDGLIPYVAPDNEITDVEVQDDEDEGNSSLENSNIHVRK